MKRTVLKVAVLVTVAASSLWVGSTFAQQAYPTKPITLVIPFPPGGGTDAIGRLLGKKLSEHLGQPVIVDNRAGAGTIVGAGSVARATPDGHTLLISSGTTFTVNPAIHAKLPYDPVRSFEPIGLIGRGALILLANRDVPMNSLQEVIAAAKASPGKYVYGSYGTATTAHFAGEMIWKAAGVNLMHVPYKGSSPAMTDLIGGQIPLTIDTVAAALPQLKAGRVKAIAVTTSKRSSLLPDVPTIAERGLSGIDVDSWLAIVAPKGITPEVKSRLEKALAESLADPETKSRMLATGVEPSYANSAEVTKLINEELPRMKTVAQQANIKAE